MDTENLSMQASLEYLEDNNIGFQEMRELIDSNEGVFNRLGNSVKRAFDTIMRWNFQQPVKLYPDAAGRALKNAKEEELQDFVVYIPTRYKGKLSPFVDDLYNVHVLNIREVRRNVTEAFRRRLAEIINSKPPYKKFETLFPEDKFWSLANCKKQKEELRKFSDPDSNRGTQAFSDTYDDAADYLQVSKRMQMTNSTYWTHAKPSDLRKDSEALATLAEKAFEKLSEAGDKDLIKILVADSETVAYWLEYYALVVTRCVDTTTAISDTEKKLIKKF